MCVGAGMGEPAKERKFCTISVQQKSKQVTESIGDSNGKPSSAQPSATLCDQGVAVRLWSCPRWQIETGACPG